VYKNASAPALSSPTNVAPWTMYAAGSAEDMSENVLIGRVLNDALSKLLSNSNSGRSEVSSPAAATATATSTTSVSKKHQKKTKTPARKQGPPAKKATEKKTKATRKPSLDTPSPRSRRATRSSTQDTELLGGIEQVGLVGTNHSDRKKRLLEDFKQTETTTVNSKGEIVTKVKMLTGSLFLYKGNTKRRAEFVRSR
jgi:hypothetical protein